MENEFKMFKRVIRERPIESTVVLGGYFLLLTWGVLVAMKGISIEDYNGNPQKDPTRTNTPTITQEKFPPSIHEYYATLEAKGTIPVVPLRRETPTVRK